MSKRKIPPIHPGEILFEEFLIPMGIAIDELAQNIGVPFDRLSAIIHGESDLTAEIALRLGRYFNISPQFWLNLQAHYDLETAADKLGGRLIHEVNVFESV